MAWCSHRDERPTPGAAGRAHGRGMTGDANDPESIALRGLIDHTAERTAKVEEMAAALDALGACPVSCKEEPRFDAERLNERGD